MLGVEDGSVDLVTVCQVPLDCSSLQALAPCAGAPLPQPALLPVPGGGQGAAARRSPRRHWLPLLQVATVAGSPLYTVTRRPSEPGLCAAMEAVYAATLPYWSYPRHWVDSAYRSLPPPPSHLLSLVSRQDDHFTETTTSLAGWAAYIASWSGFRGLCKEVGAAEGRRLLEEFLERCLDLLGRRADTPASVEVTLKTEYWLIVYTK